MTAMVLLSEWQRSQVEFWKPIPTWEGYDASNFGRIRSRWKRAGWRYGYKLRRDVTPIVLNCSGHKQGYRTTTLKNQGRRKTYMVHRLVAEAFLDNPRNAPEVNHLTGVKHDNRLGNLEWATRKENQQHAWRTGLITTEKVVGGFGWLSKVFTERDVIEIRDRRALGESCEILSREFNVSNGCISEIVTGVTFAEVGGPRTRRFDLISLTFEQVRNIRVEYAQGATQKDLSERYNIAQSEISRAVNHKRQYANIY